MSVKYERMIVYIDGDAIEYDLKSTLFHWERDRLVVKDKTTDEKTIYGPMGYRRIIMIPAEPEKEKEAEYETILQ